MDRLSPSVQEEIGVHTSATEGVAAPPPLLDAPTSALVAGVVGGLAVFVAIMWAIIQARVVKPARSRSFDKNTTFFEPAGADAEITFEDPAAREPAQKKRGWFSRKPKKQNAEPPAKVEAPPEEDVSEHGMFDEEEAEITIERPDEPEPPAQTPAPETLHTYDEEAERDPFTELAPELSAANASEPHPKKEKKKGRSPFSNLFGARDRVHQEPTPAPAEQAYTEQNDDHHIGAAALYEDAADNAEDEARRKEEMRALADAEITRARAAAEAEIAEARALADAEARAARQEREARERAERNAREAETARETAIIAARESALEAKVAEMSRRIEEQLETTTALALTAKTTESHNGRNDGVDSAAHDGAPISEDTLIALLNRHFENVEASLSASINAVNKRLDEVTAAGSADLNLAAQIGKLNHLLSTKPPAPVVNEPAKASLADVIETALPDDAYAFRKPLSNGRIADCAVTLAEGRETIVVDALFPVAAYERNKKVRDAGVADDDADDTFRAALLSHVAAISENYIVPGETAPSAMLLVPSETIYSDLRARFPDLVEESNAAKVWMVSPSSLIATLHTLRALAEKTPPPVEQEKPAPPPAQELNASHADPDTEALEEEVAILRARLETLEQFVEAGRRKSWAREPGYGGFEALDEAPEIAKATPTESPSTSLSAEEEAFERLEREEALREARERAAQSIDRPPFPLR